MHSTSFNSAYHPWPNQALNPVRFALWTLRKKKSRAAPQLNITRRWCTKPVGVVKLHLTTPQMCFSYHHPPC